MGKPVSEEEFGRLLASPRRSAFHLETQPFYAMDYERADFERFLAGTPRPPSEVDWWRPWLDQIAALTGQGVRIGRVRVLEQPPTDYQRWLMWADPWHAKAGEDIRYMTRGKAEQAGLPLNHDWWLLDDERVIITLFNDAGGIGSKTLAWDDRTVALYRGWRELAIRHATPAGRIAAA
jgi:hypothetical protein